MKTKGVTESRQVAVMLGYLCANTEAEATLVRKVEILDRFGMSDDEIALICDCRPQSVRDARQKLKRKKNHK